MREGGRLLGRLNSFARRGSHRVRRIPPPAFLNARRRAAYRTVVAWWAIGRLLVLGTVLVVQSLGWPGGVSYPSIGAHPFAVLGDWDGRWYRMIAEHGYLVIPHHQNDTAFFPLFPVILAGAQRLGLSAFEAGVLIANVSFLVGLFALYELARTWLPERSAVRTAVYASLFPLGYVFSMEYPEGLVVAMLAIAGVCARRGRWGVCAACAALAALARQEALLLTLPLAALVVQQRHSLTAPQLRKALVAVLAAPAAVAGLALYDWRTFGDPIAFSEAQRAWGRRLSPGGAVHAVGQLVHSIGTPNEWLFRDAAFCLLYLALLYLALRARVPWSWVVAGALIVLLPLETGSFTSDGRFGLLALPVYAGLAASVRRPWIDRVVRGSSMGLLVLASATILLRWP